MNTNPFEAAEHEANEQCEREIADAKAKRDRRIEALRDLKQMGYTLMAPTTAPTPSTRAIIKGLDLSENRPGMTEAVKIYVSNLTVPTFTIVDVASWLNQKWPGMIKPEKRASLSSILIGLNERNVIGIHHRGKGSTPTVYRKSNSDQQGLLGGAA